MLQYPYELQLWDADEVLVILFPETDAVLDPLVMPDDYDLDAVLCGPPADKVGALTEEVPDTLVPFPRDGVEPFVDVCNSCDKGIFVLVKTSNPSSGEFQDVLTRDGVPMYELVGQKVREWGAKSMDGRYSNVGAVVGATYPEQGERLRKLMPETFILAPGYGAQGASAEDLSAFFDEDGSGAIVNSSRGIIAAYTKDAYRDFGPEGFAQAARAAALDMIEDLRQAIAKR